MISSSHQIGSIISAAPSLFVFWLQFYLGQFNDFAECPFTTALATDGDHQASSCALASRRLEVGSRVACPGSCGEEASSHVVATQRTVSWSGRSVKRNMLSTGEPTGADAPVVQRLGSLAFHRTAVEASDLRKGFRGGVISDFSSHGLA